MSIDGQPATFELDRMNFVRRTLKKTSVLEEPQDLPVVSATLGIIYVHRRIGLPHTATMKWGHFQRQDYVYEGRDPR